MTYIAGHRFGERRGSAPPCGLTAGVNPAAPWQLGSLRAQNQRRRRPGFTLLEVILAAVITVLLMAALYATLSMQYWHADAGRNVVEQSTLAQGLMKRVADDIGQELAPLVPDTSPSSSSSASGTGAAGGSATSAATTTTPAATTAAATTPASGSASSTSTSSTSGATANISGGPVTFNLMVQGTDSQLTLYLSRFPRELVGAGQDSPPLVSDLRRVSYWLAGSGKSAGLARQEVKQETSNDALTTMPPDVPDADSLVISNRVKSLTFAYWDGQAWQDSWDGTTATGSDGTTPQGPPMAIRIEMKIAPKSGADDAKTWKTYRQTIFIPTANRLMPTTLAPLGTTGE